MRPARMRPVSRPHHIHPISLDLLTFCFSTGWRCRTFGHSLRRGLREAGRTMSARPGTGAVVIATLAGLVWATPASATDEQSWLKFPGSAYASQSDPSDRSFVREWEATPPKGYPTLSPANIPATKAAIRRYTEIVAAGGWRPVPEVQLQAGMSHPAVALLRERLFLS